MPEHRNLLAYEKTGTSRRFSWYSLPEGCDAVFFPGCALPGTRPETTMWAFEHLRESIPALGIILDCCTKPSHDLGREEYFSAMFGELKSYLLAKGIRRVLVACPNCWKIFTDYAPEMKVETVYEVLAESSAPSGKTLGEAVIHDSCVMRKAGTVFSSVRRLAEGSGLSLREMDHSREKTLCCGEGGGVGYVAPDLAGAWTEKRAKEAGGRKVIAYCAGCANLLGGKAEVSHILDVCRGAQDAKASRGFSTYLNRLRLKKRLKREFPAKTTRERTFAAGKEPGKLTKPLLLLALLALAVAGVRVAGLGEYFDEERLRALIEGFGPMAPVLYILLYLIGPSLFLPGLPLTIVGGILFGPFWGVVYTITSATAGACLAFLISRYVARGFVERRLVGSKWRKLDDEVAKNGWKVVAFTRLVPLFPFNLLNYALGMTKIGFLPYAVTTFFCMLPATIAYIVFSSSLLDLAGGKVSPALLLGILLVAAVSLIPLLAKKRGSEKRE